jgi:hypothetical protein
MKPSIKTFLLTGVLTLMASPALALPSHVPSNHGTSHIPSNQGTSHAPSGTLDGSDNPGTSHRPDTVGPDASLPAKAKAYGKKCQNESKKHVAGQKGSPFSQCVTAMAKLTSGQTNNPRTACKTESKKHVAGTPGTPFSRCVSDGAKQLATQHDEPETVDQS